MTAIERSFTSFRMTVFVMLSLRSILLWLRDPSLRPGWPLSRDPSLRSGWPLSRDPSFRSGWPSLGWRCPSCWACEASYCVFQRLFRDPSLRLGWPSRDPSLRSGWPYPSCWACEASCYDWVIFDFVQDDRHREILHFVQDDRYQEILHFVQDDRHWDDGVRHAELAKHLSVYFRDFSEILHFVQDDHREILHFVQDDRIRHAELAKHLTMYSRDPSLRSGWRCPSCWASEASFMQKMLSSDTVDSLQYAEFVCDRLRLDPR